MYDFDITWPLNLVVLMIDEGRRYQFNEIHLFEKIKKREARMKENSGTSTSANIHMHHAWCNYVRIIIVLHLIFHYFSYSFSWFFSKLGLTSWLGLRFGFEASSLFNIEARQREACRSSKWSPKLRPIKKREWGGLNPNFCSL